MQISFDQCDPLQPLVRINNEERFAGVKAEEQQTFVSRALQVGAGCKWYCQGQGLAAGVFGGAMPLRCCPRPGRMQQMQRHKGREGEGALAAFLLLKQRVAKVP